MKIKGEKININQGNTDQYIEDLKGSIPFGTKFESNVDLRTYIDHGEYTIYSFRIKYEDSNKGFIQVNPDNLPANVKSAASTLYPDQEVKVEARNQEIFTAVKQTFKDLIERVIGDAHKGFISNWNLLPSDLQRLPLEKYNGQILERSDKTLPVFLEWLKDYNMLTHRIWTYGTWGLILPADSQDKLIEWLNTKDVNEDDIKDFFETISAIFWVKGELDSISILVKSLSPIALDLDKIIES